MKPMPWPCRLRLSVFAILLREDAGSLAAHSYLESESYCAAAALEVESTSIGSSAKRRMGSFLSVLRVLKA